LVLGVDKVGGLTNKYDRPLLTLHGVLKIPNLCRYFHKTLS
jgi:hypothetical protein